jgi:iron complex outermembrane recepter protein
MSRTTRVLGPLVLVLLTAATSGVYGQQSPSNADGQQAQSNVSGPQAQSNAGGPKAPTTANGTIQGQLVDQQRAALPGVTVTAKNAQGVGTQSTVTDAEGRYQLSVLPGRTYTVTADLSGFATFERANVTVDAGQSVTLDVQLELGGLNETVVVVGQEATRSPDTIAQVKDVAESISIVPGAELVQTEATDISALTQHVANVQFNYGNQRTMSLSLRGIGRQGQTEAQDPSVGITVDGVNYAYNALASSYDFTDVDAIEVTRGPQGTLEGKNSSLGVVDVTTKRPSFTPTADTQLTLGERGTVLARFAMGGPITDTLAWRGTFSASKGEGDITNAYNRDNTYTNVDRVTGRVQLLYVPSPRFSARFAVDMEPDGSETTNGRTFYTPTPLFYSNGTKTNLATDASTLLGRSWFTANGSYSYAGNYLYGAGQDEVDYNGQAGLVTGGSGTSAELNWALGGAHTLTSITAYRDYHFNAVNDEGTPFDILRNSGGFFNNYRQVSQEVRLSSARGGFVSYQFGLYYINVFNDVDYQKQWGSDAGAWFANATQYSQLDANGAGRFLMQQSLDNLSMSYNAPAGTQLIRNNSAAPFAQADWHLSSAFTVTTGARLTLEDRQNTASSFITANGDGALLNPAVVNGVNLGGFSSTSTGALGAGNSLTQLNLADSVASQYFGVAATSVAGAAYNSLTAAQQLQVADAKAIRAAQIGVVFNPEAAQPFKAAQPAFLLSPLYKISDDVNTYVSVQYGQKAGIAQFVNGVSDLIPAEKSISYEWGVKTVTLDRKLLVNADLFLTNITNYQQAVRVLDVYTTDLNNNGIDSYATATGSAPKVQAKGLEVDGLFTGIPRLSVRFSGAYNDAFYKYFPNSAQPVENGYTGAGPYQNVSGQQLPGAAKLTSNVAADYRIPIYGDKHVHAAFNTAFTSRFNSDPSLSEYAWIPAHSLTDLSVGFGKSRFEVNLIAKNVFNNSTPITQTWNSYTPAFPRWLGVQFVGKL